MKVLQLIIFIFYGMLPFDCVIANGQFYPNHIEVIKDSKTVLTNIEAITYKLQPYQVEVSIYDIDAVDHFEAKINKTLPGNEVEAREVIDQYIKSIGREKFKKDIAKAYQGMMKTMQYKLEKYPAIIFDGESVIYGVTDLADALSRYQNWKSTQGNQ